MKKSELLEACKDVLPEKTFPALIEASFDLPVILNMACDEAFVHDLTGPQVEILREAAKQLRSGSFDFEPEELKVEKEEIKGLGCSYALKAMTLPCLAMSNGDCPFPKNECHMPHEVRHGDTRLEMVLGYANSMNPDDDGLCTIEEK